MNTKELHEQYGLLTKSSQSLEGRNPFQYERCYSVGKNTVRIREDSGIWTSLAIVLNTYDKELPRFHTRFLVFRVHYKICWDILDGIISLREAFDVHSDEIVYIIEQGHYSSSPYDIMAFSRKDVPSFFVDELEKEKDKIDYIW